MRVIAGSVKGKRLRSPKGATRPTTELVRGAIFSIIQPMLAEEWRAVDLYAGSGALGIEALSRGAEWVAFVESDPRCCATIKANLDLTGLASLAKVYCCSVNRALSILQGPYDVVMLDPPYSDPALLGTVERAVASGVVGDGTTLVVQHSTRQPLPPAIGHFYLFSSRRYGDTCLSIYRQEARN